MKKRYIIPGIIILVLIAFRLYLPTLVKNQINQQIDAVEGYFGDVDKVTMQLFRGSVQLHDLTIYETASADPSAPFLQLRYSDYNIHWGALFDGRLVGEIYMDSLIVNFTVSKEKEPMEEERINLAARLEELMPFRINIFQITNGQFSFRDPTIDPTLHVYLSDFFLLAENLANVTYPNDTLPASFRVESQIMESGFVTSGGHLNIMAQIPEFEFDLELEEVQLAQFNDFTSAYASLQIEEGLMNMYMEAVALDGYIDGYLKPVIENLVIETQAPNESVLQDVYEGLSDAVAGLLENPNTDNIGTRVPFEGRIDNPDVATWDAAWTLIRNAFFESVTKGVEGVIEVEDVQ